VVTLLEICTFVSMTRYLATHCGTVDISPCTQQQMYHIQMAIQSSQHQWRCTSLCNVGYHDCIHVYLHPKMEGTKVNNPQHNMDTCASLLYLCPFKAVHTHLLACHGVNACTNCIIIIHSDYMQDCQVRIHTSSTECLTSSQQTNNLCKDVSRPHIAVCLLHCALPIMEGIRPP